MLKLVLTSLLLLALGASCTVLAQAEQRDLAHENYLGEWSGIITQEIGPTTRYFDMVMNVAPVTGSDSVYSVSSHVMDGKYHAYMTGEAFRTHDGQLFVAESEIIRADSIPGMEWCIKRLQLNRSMEEGVLHLRGQWAGDTSFGACEPGAMDLVRELVRP